MGIRRGRGWALIRTGQRLLQCFLAFGMAVSLAQDVRLPGIGLTLRLGWSPDQLIRALNQAGISASPSDFDKQGVALYELKDLRTKGRVQLFLVVAQERALDQVSVGLRNAELYGSWMRDVEGLFGSRTRVSTAESPVHCARGVMADFSSWNYSVKFSRAPADSSICTQLPAPSAARPSSPPPAAAGVGSPRVDAANVATVLSRQSGAVTSEERALVRSNPIALAVLCESMNQRACLVLEFLKDRMPYEWDWSGKDALQVSAVLKRVCDQVQTPSPSRKALCEISLMLEFYAFDVQNPKDKNHPWFCVLERPAEYERMQECTYGPNGVPMGCDERRGNFTGIPLQNQCQHPIVIALPYGNGIHRLRPGETVIHRPRGDLLVRWVMWDR